MYSKFKPMLFILVAIIMVMVGMYPMLFSKLNAQKRDNRVEKRKGMIPIPLASEEKNLQKRLERENKNRRYNNPRSEDLTTQGEGEIFGRVSEAALPVPFPISGSDLIVVGKIAKAQPYFAESKTTIYSEFLIEIEEVLKNGTGNPLAVGDFVSADREGGAILMPNGQVIQYKVGGIGALPEQNTRYVLFLQGSENNCTILSGYEINDDGIIPLEDGKDREIYIGESESNFIAEVKRNISSNN